MSINPLYVTVEEDGHVVAEASVRIHAQDRSVQADLHLEAGHLPVGIRTRLVDAVLDRTAAAPGTRLDVTLPAGDGEILDRLRERCDALQTRPAGASCLATGSVASA